MREHAADIRRIAHAAIAGADPRRAVRHALTSLELNAPSRTRIIAIGKAATGMTLGALDSLPAPPRSSLVIAPTGAPPDGLEELRDAAHVVVLGGSHPLPDASSVAAGSAVQRLLAETDIDDIVLVLLSGGASALCVSPVHGLDISSYREAVRALMHAGADIGELNTVRAHIDRLKGGGMARLLMPARGVGLVVSDVVGNRIDVIASGPLTPPQSTAADALAILARYGVTSRLPAEVVHELESAAAATSGSDSSMGAYDHIATHVILDNSHACAAAAAEATRLGYTVRIDETPVTGTARTAGQRFARSACAAAAGMQAGDAPVCLVSGGETTVAVTGSGTGGRNQELVLAAAILLDGRARITVASFGTDGVDGPTDAAGAVADGDLVSSVAGIGLNATESLHDNDSYRILDAVDGLIRTGPTGTNVMDVQIALIAPPA